VAALRGKRDEQGWRVPRPGTIAAKIYALAKTGLSTREIADKLGRGRNNVGVHLFKIKRPDRGNQLGNAWRKKQQGARKPIPPEEAYVRKVATAMGLPLTQARTLVSSQR
jgi:hypothetical protein